MAETPCIIGRLWFIMFGGGIVSFLREIGKEENRVIREVVHTWDQMEGVYQPRWLSVAWRRVEEQWWEIDYTGQEWILKSFRTKGLVVGLDMMVDNEGFLERFCQIRALIRVRPQIRIQKRRGPTAGRQCHDILRQGSQCWVTTSTV